MPDIVTGPKPKSKSSTLIIAVLAILFIVIAWFAYSNGGTGSKSDISLLLAGLKDETSIDFSNNGDMVFQWKTGANESDSQAELEIKGEGFSVDNLTEEQASKISLYFSKQGFVSNALNTNVGQLFGQIAYQRAPIICLVKGGFEDMDAIESNNSSFDIMCGKID